MRVDIHEWITDVYISVITIALDRKPLSEKITTLYYTLHYKYILISSQYLLQNFAYNGTSEIWFNLKNHVMSLIYHF